MQLVTCVPSAERVESVYSRDPKLLAWLGTRRADGDGAQAQTLVVTETRLLHQLLHGGLLWGSQGAAGQRFTIVRHWNTSMQSCVFLPHNIFLPSSSLSASMAIYLSHQRCHHLRARSFGCLCHFSSVYFGCRGPWWSFQPSLHSSQ